MKIDLDTIAQKQQYFKKIQDPFAQLLQTETFTTNNNQKLLFHLQTVQQKLHAVDQFLATSLQRYEQIETQLKKEAEALTSSKKWKSDVFSFHHNFQFKNNSNLSRDDKLVIGIAGVGNADFAVFQAAKNISAGNLKGSVHINVGFAAVTGKGSAIVLKEGKIKPSLDADIDGQASLLHAQAKLNYQVGQLGLQGDGDVHIGTVSAKVKAVLSKEEMTMKAEYGVAAVSGKAHGRISLFGFHVDATLQGEVLAIGGGAEFSKGKKYVEIGGKLSLFAGLGFKIRLSHD